MIFGVILSSIALDFLVKRKSRSNQMTPEQRLPLMSLAGLIFPGALMMFGVRLFLISNTSAQYTLTS